MSAINNLTQAQFDLVTEDNSTRLDNDFVNPTPIDDVNALGRQPRIRRQTGLITDSQCVLHACTATGNRISSALQLLIMIMPGPPRTPSKSARLVIVCILASDVG